LANGSGKQALGSGAAFEIPASRPSLSIFQQIGTSFPPGHRCSAPLAQHLHYCILYAEVDNHGGISNVG
jgi:hypothetical protein